MHALLHMSLQRNAPACPGCSCLELPCPTGPSPTSPHPTPAPPLAACQVLNLDVWCGSSRAELHALLRLAGRAQLRR